MKESESATQMVNVTAYPSPGKAKAHMICEAFAHGCGGVVSDPRKGLRPGAAFFYGIVPETRALWDQCKAEGRDWYYADNSYFDRGRQAYFRVTKNSFQVSELVTPDYKRLDSIGVKVKPWRETGSHILICEQSAAFMELCGARADWLNWVLCELRKYTTRELRVRNWNRDKAKLLATLKTDLTDAWAVVTHMSASANEALMQGVPAVATGECAAVPMSGSIESIENPLLPSGRSAWAAGLVTRQWTREEITDGECWRKLNDQ